MTSTRRASSWRRSTLARLPQCSGVHPDVSRDLPNCRDDEERRQNAKHHKPADNGTSRPTAETLAGAVSMTSHQWAECVAPIADGFGRSDVHAREPAHVLSLLTAPEQPQHIEESSRRQTYRDTQEHEKNEIVHRSPATYKLRNPRLGQCSGMTPERRTLSTVPTDERQEKDYREVFAFGDEYLVFIDDAHREEDGALRVLLEQYVGTPEHSEPLCRSEDELRQALLGMGARAEQAATAAALIWARHMGRGASG